MYRYMLGSGMPVSAARSRAVSVWLLGLKARRMARTRRAPSAPDGETGGADRDEPDDAGEPDEAGDADDRSDGGA
jgi:hypothetical protein